MTFVVVAKWIARPGHEEEVWQAIQNLVGPTRREPGCLAYLPHRSLEDERTFLLYEQYVDEAAYGAHRDSDHFRRYAVEGGIPLLEARERGFYTLLNP